MSTIDLSVVLVHYRAPDLLRRAIAAVEEDLRESALSGEILVVDNSGDLPRGDPPMGSSLRILRPGENLGYAGGARLAIDHSKASAILLMNCDVLVQRQCLGLLLAELRNGASVAGPALYWDEGLGLRLPPSEPRGRLPELSSALSHRLPPFAWMLRRARRKHAYRHWSASASLHSVSLSGCLLAFSRAVWTETGGMSREFQLYFEETDWLLRVARAGHSIRFVPQARAVHLYDRSASGEPQTARWFRESEQRFRRLHYGAFFTKLLAWVAGTPTAQPVDPIPSLEPPKLAVPRKARGGWVEVGAAPGGYPAAGEKLSQDAESWTMPKAVWNSMRPGNYTLVIVDAKGREHGLCRVTKA